MSPETFVAVCIITDGAEQADCLTVTVSPCGRMVRGAGRLRGDSGETLGDGARRGVFAGAQSVAMIFKNSVQK